MKFEEFKDDNIWILRFLEERFDLMSVSEFKEKISLGVQSGNNNILLNFKNVCFVDSSGLASLVYCFKLVGSNGRFGLCEVNDIVISMLKLTRMDRVFKIYETEEQAVLSFE